MEGKEDIGGKEVKEDTGEDIDDIWVDDDSNVGYKAREVRTGSDLRFDHLRASVNSTSADGICELCADEIKESGSEVEVGGEEAIEINSAEDKGLLSFRGDTGDETISQLLSSSRGDSETSEFIEKSVFNFLYL